MKIFTFVLTKLPSLMLKSALFSYSCVIDLIQKRVFVEPILEASTNFKSVFV